MIEKLNGTTTWLIRALWSVLFFVGGYFINTIDKRLGAVEARADYLLQQNLTKEAIMADRLARLEERVRLHQRRVGDRGE